MTDKLRIGVSACLLGEKVRYDGQHKRNSFVVDVLAKLVDFVPVCPEVECGLPVPREAMHLVGDPAAPRLMTLRTHIDLTDQMHAWTKRKIPELRSENLCGFIFKSRSPSSGMERVKVYNGRGGMSGRGAGLFAKAFMDAFPLLPVEDEGRLNDIDLRENFIERLFTLKRYRDTVVARPSVSALIEFHARHKYLVMAHHQVRTRELGRLVASTTAHNLRRVIGEYEPLLLQTLKLCATPAKHTNVLTHIAGYFKRELDAQDRRELHGLIDQYHDGMIPLIVPMTLIKHYVRKLNITYLMDQVYLNPHPAELKLRNHA